MTRVPSILAAAAALVIVAGAVLSLWRKGESTTVFEESIRIARARDEGMIRVFTEGGRRTGRLGGKAYVHFLRLLENSQPEPPGPARNVRALLTLPNGPDPLEVWFCEEDTLLLMIRRDDDVPSSAVRSVQEGLASFLPLLEGAVRSDEPPPSEDPRDR